MFLFYPLKDIYITSPFGMRTHPVTGARQLHNGVDLRATTGTPIFSPANAIVDSLHSNPIGGKQIILNHDNGINTGYAHLSEYKVNQGDRVKAGQIIGYTGNTGITTAPHLHFTYTIDGVKKDPTKLFEIIDKNAAFKPVLAATNYLPFVLLAAAGIYIYNNKN
jgi:murein DD-endopeptidase MepM/ murein hydrolase activator NlpD